MGCKKQGVKNRVIVNQKEKRPGCIFSFMHPDFCNPYFGPFFPGSKQEQWMQIDWTSTFKWSFFIEPSLDGSSKNQKSCFFLLGLKYTLRTCFEPKTFLSKSYPELSNQVLSFLACQICQQLQVHLPHIFFQLFDLWWSSLDIINDF